MIESTIQKAINIQVKNELESAYIYLAMAVYFDSNNLAGMAAWMRGQVHEETLHAMKLQHHLLERGGQVELFDLKLTATKWESVAAVWEATLAHERFISGEIRNLMKLAREECDFAAESLVRWFIDEQVEEEANVDRILGEIKMVGSKSEGLLMLDRELGARIFAPGSPFDPASLAALGK
jgi:ferritin